MTLKDVSVRDVLRGETRESHENLHHHSSFVALFDGTLDLDDYRLLAQRLHGFYAPLDAAIQRVIAETLTETACYDHVSRSDFLAQDLRDLGFSDQQINDTPQCPNLSEIVTTTSLGGVLYVIEGATLGGAQIDRAAAKLLTHDQPDGRRYWAWCRSHGKQRWSAMIRYLETKPAHGDVLDQLTAGALDTFQAFAEWLQPLDRTGLTREAGRS
ncbi:biliverdin-producing heme oxygenase [Roseovarius sp. 2305UL8-3]|uniref:biliverdin-producing heme oxygenase n=1 Tax=Roseovarius conchicola TaxID=3121636 RepID=UPI003527F383